MSGSAVDPGDLVPALDNPKRGQGDEDNSKTRLPPSSKTAKTDSKTDLKDEPRLFIKTLEGIKMDKTENGMAIAIQEIYA